MKKISSSLLLCFLITFSLAQTLHRKTRAESFFGLHLDFHANENDSLIGQTLTEGMIDTLLDEVKPDFIQVDCKGHPGYSSYPTQVGNQTKGYVKDPLKLFRKVTEKKGVALYVHYSGVLDGRAIQLHPAWAKQDANGIFSKQETSCQSAYADSLLMPQLKELAGVYHVDGAWVDGDCWAAQRDYSPAAIAAFTSKTGIKKAPVNPEDPGWAEWTAFTRGSFKSYMKKYIDAIHQYKPGFQITSNWAFTGFMPEPVDVNVDFISGDVASSSSVYSAAFESRCIAPQGKPWDLMSWSFSYNFGNSFGSPKSPVQIMQEAAEVMTMGGSFQVYYTQNHDASIKPWIIPGAAEIASFCRSRVAFCKDASPLPQIAVLYSTHAFYTHAKAIYGYSADGIANEVKGITMSLLDKQYSLQVLMEHSLKGRMKQFPVIVIPGWRELDPDFKKELDDYVLSGGNLVLIGPGPITFFSEETGIKNGKEFKSNNLSLGYQGRMSTLQAEYIPVQPPANAVNIGGLYQNQDLRFPSSPAASIIKRGKGKIAMLYTTLGSSYIEHRTQLGADFLAAVISQLIPDPMVQVEGSAYIHVNLMRKNGKTYLHLINAGGQHDNEKVYEWPELTPLYNIRLKLKTPKKPRKLMLMPEQKHIPFVFQNGQVTFTVPKLDIYSIVQVDD